MPNERLRALLLERGETPDKLAEALQVDGKTVERWITKGRIPYRKHRYSVAAHFGVEEAYIWPDALDRDQVAAVSESEIVALYPHRTEVPRDVWGHLFSQAEHEIGVLVYAGLFLSEDVGVQRIFKEKAKAGVRVRILLGDPGSQVVTDRGEDEGVGDAMAAKIRNALALYRPLRAVEGVEFRFHQTILYNSIYRGDDQLLVNTHVQGLTASHAPVWHLRKLAGGELTSLYIDSFERVWQTAEPVDRSLFMARRIDYYDDPNAPKANSLVPSVNVVVENGKGGILLIRRSDNDNWAIPGGAIDLGESLIEAARRETKEETGVTCEITGLVGIYTDPKHVILYTSNGEVRQEFSIVLIGSAIGGKPTSSSESSEVRWVVRDDLNSYRMDRSMSIRINHYLAGRASNPYLA